jgi:hypothetical protein
VNPRRVHLKAHADRWAKTMCTLRVSSKKATLAPFLARARMPVYESHSKGDVQRHGRGKGSPFDDSGFKSSVSEKDWNDLPGQISDAIRFLRRYQSDLLRLKDEFRCEMQLDFPYELRIGKNHVCAQFDFLPPNLIVLAGLLAIGIEMSLYPAVGEVRSKKLRVGKPKTGKG